MLSKPFEVCQSRRPAADCPRSHPSNVYRVPQMGSYVASSDVMVIVKVEREKKPEGENSFRDETTF